MKKRSLMVVVLVVLHTSLFAGTFDLGISLGTASHWGDTQYDNSRLKLAWGVTLGLNPTWELDVQAHSALVPDFFGDTTVSVLVQKAFLGQRSTGTRVAGIGINSLVGAGVLFSTYNPLEVHLPSHVLLSITPLTVGNPISAKRERLLSVTLAYNFFTSEVSVLFNLLVYDFYLVGTYRDYR